MWQTIRPSGKNLYYWQLGVLAVFLLVWQLVSRNQQYAFFLGEPVKVLGRVWSWFMPFGFGPSLLFPEGLPGNADIYSHLGTTLLETLLAFGIGTLLGLCCGLWLALAPEGTRHLAQAWRSGFYHVAHEAAVPVGLVFLDYRKREVGVEHFIMLSGDKEADMAEIRQQLAHRTGRHPERAAPIRLNA